MAKHAAPVVRPSAAPVVRTTLGALASGVAWAAPRVARGAGRGVRSGVVLTGRASWQAGRVLAMLTLAALWVGLLLLLLMISAVVPQGAQLRQGVSDAMIKPLGMGARQALAMHADQDDAPVKITKAQRRRMPRPA